MKAYKMLIVTIVYVLIIDLLDFVLPIAEGRRLISYIIPIVPIIGRTFVLPIQPLGFPINLKAMIGMEIIVLGFTYFFFLNGYMKNGFDIYWGFLILQLILKAILYIIMYVDAQTYVYVHTDCDETYTIEDDIL